MKIENHPIFFIVLLLFVACAVNIYLSLRIQTNINKIEQLVADHSRDQQRDYELTLSKIETRTDLLKECVFALIEEFRTTAKENEKGFSSIKSTVESCSYKPHKSSHDIDDLYTEILSLSVSVGKINQPAANSSIFKTETKTEDSIKDLKTSINAVERQLSQIAISLRQLDTDRIWNNKR